MNRGLRLRDLMAVALALVLVGGCSTPYSGTSVKYSYEPLFSFSGLKTYRWAAGTPSAWGDPLVEANVRFVADRVLEAKGLTSKTEKPDLVISMRYDSNYAYELRSLTLSISRGDRNEQVWRGTASGSIRTDASSGDLKSAVEAILVNFPPK